MVMTVEPAERATGFKVRLTSRFNLCAVPLEQPVVSIFKFQRRVVRKVSLETF